MIADLKPYAAMKDSGVPWLGTLPRHWEIKRNKLLLREVNNRSEDGSEELLTVSQYTGVTRRRDRSSGDGDLLTNAESLIGYKRVEPDDLVMNIMLAWNGSLGVSPITGIVSPAYCVFRVNGSIVPRFLHYLFRTPLFTGVFKKVSTGVVDSRLRLYPEVFFRLSSLLPPLDEQAAIVRFLDHADRQIQRAIRAKQKLVKLLEEQKQAIIHRAVTRGLDPNVRLKPSGVEWLGDVPEHWEARRLKSLARIRYGLGQPPRESVVGLPLIRATNVDHGRILERNLVRVDPDDVPKSRGAFLDTGEIIVVRSGAYTADSAIISEKYAGAVAGYDMVLTPQKANAEFLALALLSRYIRDDQLIIASMRSAQPHLNAEELGVAVIVVPPEVEQARIVVHVVGATKEIDATVEAAEREVSLLREYRTRLIADVVTGKLDVREAAARLLDEPDEPGALGDASDAWADAEEEISGVDTGAVNEEAEA